MKELSKLSLMSLQQKRKFKRLSRKEKKRCFYTELIFSKLAVERSVKNFLKSEKRYLRFRVSLNLSKKKLLMNKFREVLAIK
jgi:hypothetical protein